MRKITSKQRAVIVAILDFTEKHKYAPTVSELTDMVGLKSSSTMHGYLERLKLLGLVYVGTVVFTNNHCRRR